jgi:methylmalonyl-CoA mutase
MSDPDDMQRRDATMADGFPSRAHGQVEPGQVEFGQIEYAEWRRRVERDLGTASFERRLVKRVAGVEVQPLYTAKDARDPGLAGLPPYRRGGSVADASALGWSIGQDILPREPRAAGEAAARAIQGGATHLTLRCHDGSERSAALSAAGIQLANLPDMADVLANVPLEGTAVALEGPLSLARAAALVGHAQRGGVDLTALQGCLGLDPLGNWAIQGELPGSLENALAHVADAARWARRHCPSLRAISVNARAFHEAGADAALELGIALASGVEYLRSLLKAGLSLADASASLRFEFAVGTDVFLEIAKLRAARVTWSRAVAVAGGGRAAQWGVIHARGSRRALTRRDAWGNLLRGASETFAAAAGGADIVTTAELGEALGQSDARSQRLSRNTQLLLWHEAHLDRVKDPAGGSYYVESLTDALCIEAWKQFQAIEREGGLAVSLSRGELQRRIGAALHAARQAVEVRRALIVGISEFAQESDESPFAPEAPPIAAAPERPPAPGVAPVVDRERPFASAIGAALQGMSFRDLDRMLASGAPAQCEALVRERLAEPFERLRDRADAFGRRNGTPPTAFLANLGAPSDHGARANFSLGLLRAGGFKVVTNHGFAETVAAARAFAESGAHIAVICSTDELYEQLAEPTARALDACSPRAIVLAGNPGTRVAAYRAAGVTDFIFLGGSTVASLETLLARVEAA